MENFTLEIAENDIESQLARVRELEEGRRVLLARIEKAESAKQSVNERIYHKVQGEYKTRLQALERELEPLVMALDKDRASVGNQIREIDLDIEELRDALDELEFRHRVGELDDSAIAESRAPVEQNRGRLARKREELLGLLSRIGGSEATPSPSNAQRVEDPPVEIARGSEATPSPSDVQRVEDPPVEIARGSVETKRGAPEAERSSPQKPPQETGDYVDPTEWVGEFVQDNTPDEKMKDERGPSEEVVAPPVEPMRRSTTVPHDARERHAPDPLANLADPWDELSEPSDPSTRQAVGNPRDGAAPVGLPILTISTGSGAAKRMPLLPMTMTLGREVDNNIELKDKDVARYHARISYESGRYVIQDLEGSSGTFVNGEPITRTAISPGDVIRVGGTELRLELG